MQAARVRGADPAQRLRRPRPEVRPDLRARWHQEGFTLIEMIVVIVIMGLVAALVLVRQPWHSAGLNTEATVRALTEALRVARSRAIAQDRDVSVITRPGGF